MEKQVLKVVKEQIIARISVDAIFIISLRSSKFYMIIYTLLLLMEFLKSLLLH